MPHECRLKLHEIPLPKRGKGESVARLQEQEAKKIKAILPTRSHVVALEVGGRSWSTEQLAERLKFWMQQGKELSLLVGGPDGLDPALKPIYDEQWSLSPLTLPHPLVRVVVAEQIYRAWTVTQGHPYHRAG